MPCPYNGCTDTTWIYDEELRCNYILCNTCSARGPINYFDEAAATVYWNDRIEDAASSQDRCPHCGCTAMEWMSDDRTGDNYIKCGMCGAHGPSCSHGDEAMAIEYWSNRVTLEKPKLFAVTGTKPSVGGKILNDLEKFVNCHHQAWKCIKCGCSTTLKTLQKHGQAIKFKKAWDEVTKAVRHERDKYITSEIDMNAADILNAVLSLLEEKDPRNN